MAHKGKQSVLDLWTVQTLSFCYCDKIAVVKILKSKIFDLKVARNTYNFRIMTHKRSKSCLNYGHFQFLLLRRNCSQKQEI